MRKKDLENAIDNLIDISSKTKDVYYINRIAEIVMKMVIDLDKLQEVKK
jgi:hypothetical protein